MKTIKQIADEIGVTKQAVQQRIKKEPLASALRQQTTTNGNTIYIENSGVELIKQSFSTTIADNKLTINDNLLVDFFKEQLQEKDRQLSEKDKQIADLTETIKIQAQSINANNHNELAETLQRKLLTDETINNHNWFKNLFKRKNK